MLLNIIDKLFNLKKPVEVEGAISGDVALTDGDLTLGKNLEVDGKIKINSVEDLTDKEGSPLSFGKYTRLHKISFQNDLGTFGFMLLTSENVGQVSDSDELDSALEAITPRTLVINYNNDTKPIVGINYSDGLIYVINESTTTGSITAIDYADLDFTDEVTVL